MPKTIEKSGDGVALQVTEQARVAGLIEDDSECEPTDDGECEPTALAAVRVYAFNDVLLVVDREEMDARTVADLVAVTAKDTKSIYQGIDAAVEDEGNGVTVELPPAADAGFAAGDAAVAHPAPDLLVITKQNRDGDQLADDIVTMRRDQAAVA